MAPERPGAPPQSTETHLRRIRGGEPTPSGITGLRGSVTYGSNPNRSRAAQRLRIDRSTLRRKIQEYGIEER